MKHITDKAADALDLAIELVTLGEYGLEYPEAAPSSTFSAARHKKRAAEKDDCNRRTRKAAPARRVRTTGAPASPLDRSTPSTQPSRRRGGQTDPKRPARPHNPADIIRTPRIRPDWTRV
jgi:hypothetical protein